MQLTKSEKVKCEVSEQQERDILDVLEIQFKKASNKVSIYRNQVVVDGVNSSFGSILREDETTVTVKADNKGTGYLLEASIVYKPSVMFWVFVVIDLLLAVTVIGLVIGMAVTLGLYFYNKNLVLNGVADVLKNAKDSIE